MLDRVCTMTMIEHRATAATAATAANASTSMRRRAPAPGSLNSPLLVSFDSILSYYRPGVPVSLRARPPASLRSLRRSCGSFVVPPQDDTSLLKEDTSPFPGGLSP